MAKTIRLEVVTPERVVVEEDVETLVVPAYQGYMGIFPHHVPVLAALVPGVVRYRRGGRSYRMAVSGGFLEMARDKAVILADTAERAEDIDLARAERAEARARRRLEERAPGLDVTRAELALRRAIARRKAVEGARE